MTTRVLLSRRAHAEVEEITAYLAEHSPSAEGRFLQALERARQQLSQVPNSGVPGIRPGTRYLIVGNDIVSYRRRGDGIEIFAVRHTRRREARG
jgi:plasmid stabilization system protein ParE